MKKPHIYIDTSVLGGYFDDEFVEPTKRLFDALRAGKWVALVSDVVLDELERAPSEVRTLLDGLPPGSVETARVDDECRDLADSYVQAGVVSAAMRPDALHVAVASCRQADLIVSWNFKHLVNWSRIRAFNAVNLRLGHSMVEIRSPWEVEFDDTEEGA